MGYLSEIVKKRKNFLLCFWVSVGAKYSDLIFLFYSLSRTEICTLRQSKSGETCHRFYKRLLGSCQACTVSFVPKHGEVWEHIWVVAESTAGQTSSPGTAWSFYIYPKRTTISSTGLAILNPRGTFLKSQETEARSGLKFSLLVTVIFLEEKHAVIQFWQWPCRA